MARKRTPSTDPMYRSAKYGETWAAEYLALLERLDTDRPREKDIAALRKTLAEHPELWGTTLQHSASLVDLMLDSSNLLPETRAKVVTAHHSVRDRLGFFGASPLERLLIDHVAVTWLRVYLLECRYTVEVTRGGNRADVPYWEQRLAAAQRRYLQASQTLARIRKLRLTDLAAPSAAPPKAPA